MSWPACSPERIWVSFLAWNRQRYGWPVRRGKRHWRPSAKVKEHTETGRGERAERLACMEFLLRDLDFGFLGTKKKKPRGVRGALLYRDSIAQRRRSEDGRWSAVLCGLRFGLKLHRQECLCYWSRRSVVLCGLRLGWPEAAQARVPVLLGSKAGCAWRVRFGRC